MIAVKFLVISTILIGGLTIAASIWERFGSTEPGERFMAAMDKLIGGEGK